MWWRRSVLIRQPEQQQGLSLLPPPALISPVADAVLDSFPLRTVVTWGAVSGAAGYALEWSYSSPDKRKWSDSAVLRSYDTTMTFYFVGAQSGRWRVASINKNGREGEWSEWREFRYLR